MTLPPEDLVLVTDCQGRTLASSTGERGLCAKLVGAVDPQGRPICNRECAREGASKQQIAAFARGLPVHLSCRGLDSGERVIHVTPLPLAPEAVEPLSSREIEVLKLAAEGYTDGDIAKLLQVSSGTVRTHVRNARKKMSARSRTEAVARALVLNLLT